MTAAAAEAFGLSRRRVMAAALVTAFDPVLAWQSRSVMTETPAAFLVAAALAGLRRGGSSGALLGGLGFGLAALCRPSLLAGAALTILAGLFAPPGGMRERIERSAVIAATIVLLLLPWMIRNLVVLGHPIWTTTHGGYTLALANNPVYYREVLDGPPGRVWTGEDQWRWWDSVNRETAGMTEHQADLYLQAKVWRLARERPGDFGRATLARLSHFWSPAPAGVGLPRRRPMGHACLDRPPLGRAPPGIDPAIALVLAASRGPDGRARPDGGPRLLLDGPANARPHRAGDRPDRGRGWNAGEPHPGRRDGVGPGSRQARADGALTWGCPVTWGVRSPGAAAA